MAMVGVAAMVVGGGCVRGEGPVLSDTEVTIPTPDPDVQLDPAIRPADDGAPRPTVVIPTPQPTPTATS